MADATQTEFLYSGEELDALGEARHYYDWIADTFAPHLGPRIVEVGAGIGTFTDFLLARRAGAHVTATEPADNNFPRLARKFASDERVTPVHAYLDAVEGDGWADAVVAVNVMEHVRDDAAFLADVARLLKPGGRALLFVPALPALYGSLDEAFEHCRRYTRGELRGKLSAAGLEPREVRYMNVPGIAAWWLFSKVLRRTTITGGAAGWYDRWVIPAVRAMESVVRPPIGIGLITVAVKPERSEG